ncbi:ribonuclease H-like domain-containing protein, partial [Tanacetum coccineum]
MVSYCTSSGGTNSLLNTSVVNAAHITFNYRLYNYLFSVKNGNKVLKKTVGNVEQVYEPTTAEEKLERKNEMKARETLLMALLNKDQMKFHSYQDAKLLMEAIEKRYGGNKESKKVQKTLLKQQYENFAALSSEKLDQTFDRLQKLISQLEIQGEVIEQEDMNLKLLRSLPSEWKTHALIWRNKVEIKTISLDDLYNNLKIYEPEITGSSSTTQNPQNVAFVSSNSTNNTNITNKADNTAYGVSTTHSQCNTVNSTTGDNLCDVSSNNTNNTNITNKEDNTAYGPNSPQLAQEDLEQLHLDDLEEIDLHWEMAMLTIRARRFIKRTGRKLDINSQRVGFIGLKWNATTVMRMDILQENVGFQRIYQAEEEQPTNYALMAYTSLGISSNSDSEVDSCSKSCVNAYAFLKEQYDSLSSDYKKSQFNLISYKAGLGYNAVSPAVDSFVTSSEVLENDMSRTNKGYHAVPPPLIGTFTPAKPDLMFIDEHVESEFLDVVSNVTSSDVNTVESNHESAKNMSNTVVRPVWNNSSRVNHKNFSNKITHPYLKRSFVPQAVLTKSGKNYTASAKVNIARASINTVGASVNTAGANVDTAHRLVNTVASTPNVNHPRPKTNTYNRGYSHISRPFNRYFANKNNINNKNVNTVREKDTTARERAVGNLQQKEYKEKGVIDSGCSKHMTGNKCYLTEYEDYDAGFVSFRDGKGRKGSLRTTSGPKSMKEFSTEFEKLMHDKFQMSFMGELFFFLGLQVQQKSDGIFISQDKYVAEILKKFDFSNVKTASTPIEPNKPLIKDEEAEEVDVHVYRSMIGSLMYLTASRPNIMFVVCACARFQVTPKTSHLHAVKRIFRYLKGQPKLGLWYPRDSPFKLEAFSDSDYAIASLDRKSIIGGCQFLGKRLISWQCKKQTIIANSTTEEEYIAAANCYGQVGDEAVYKELGDRMKRVATTASSFKAEQDS